MKRILSLVMIALMILSTFSILAPKVRAQEPSLQEWFDANDYDIDVDTDETGIEIFPTGQYRISILAEMTGSAATNILGWYRVSYPNVLWELFSGSDDVRSGTSFSTTSSFGLFMNSTCESPIYTIRYSQSSLNEEGFDYTWVFEDPKISGGYIIAWEDWRGGGDRDYQDMILALSPAYILDLDKLYIELDTHHGYICELRFKDWGITDITPIDELDSLRPFSAVASPVDNSYMLGGTTPCSFSIISETSKTIMLECKNDMASIIYHFYRHEQFFDMEIVGYKAWQWVQRYSFVPEKYATEGEIGTWTEKQVIVKDPWIAIKFSNIVIATCWDRTTDNADHVTLDDTEDLPVPPGATAKGVDIGDLWAVGSLIPAGVSIRFRWGVYFTGDPWYKPAKDQFDHHLDFTLVYHTDWNNIDYTYWKKEGHPPLCQDSHLVFHLPEGDTGYKSKLKTIELFGYGKFVTRFKMTSYVDGLLGAFFLYHPTDYQSDHEEIDVEWYGHESSNKIHCALWHDGGINHRPTYEKVINLDDFLGPSFHLDDGNYHTCEIVYLPASVTIIIDNEVCFQKAILIEPPLYFYTGQAMNPANWMPTPEEEYYLYVDKTEIYKYIHGSTCLALGVACPADIHIHDPLGRHIGVDYETGEREIQIPNSIYQILPDGQYILVQTPMQGDYDVELFGTGDGSYSFFAVASINDAVSSFEESGEISHGEVCHYTMSISETGELGGISWEYVFEDIRRGTMLKISTEDKRFQFIAPEKRFSIKEPYKMVVCNHSIFIWHKDYEIKLINIAIDTRIDFCFAYAKDMQTCDRYLLIDKLGIE